MVRVRTPWREAHLPRRRKLAGQLLLVIAMVFLASSGFFMLNPSTLKQFLLPGRLNSDASASLIASDTLHRNNLVSPDLTQALSSAVYKLETDNTTNNQIQNKDHLRHSNDNNNTTSTLIQATKSTGKRKKYNVSQRRYRDMPPWMDKFPIFPSADDVVAENRVCFVHVGKTAGSTLSCYLGFQYPTCHDRIPLIPGNLPQWTTNLIHTRYDTCQRETMGWYLFTVRDPLSRLLSWFTYERPNAATSARQIRAKRPLYLDCGYQSMEEVGMALADGNRTECSRVAWRAVQGLHGYMSHNKHHYGHYYRMYWQNRQAQIQQQQQHPQQQPLVPRLLVVRTEHLEEDWASVEATLARGNNNHNHNNNNYTVQFNHKNQSSKKARDRQLSAPAQRNLCDALCEEIQVYKTLLRQAVNLQPQPKDQGPTEIDEDDAITVSMKELRHQCPIEADRDECPVRPDFGVQVEVSER